MIIKRENHLAGGSSLPGYLPAAGENELVEVIDGTPEVLQDYDDLAAAEGRKYGLIHYIISPEQSMTNEQALNVVQMLRNEFQIPLDHPMMIAKHVKKRANGSTVEHWHVGMPFWQDDGRKVQDGNSKMRNERVSRQAEVALGHGITKGRHNRFVVESLRDRGNDVVVGRLEAARIMEGTPALAAFSSKALAKAGRLGVDLPAIAHAISQADPRTLGVTLAQLEKNHEIKFTKGDRRDVILMETAAGELISNASKAIAGVSNAVTDAIIADVARARDWRDENDYRRTAEDISSVVRGSREQLRSGGGNKSPEQTASAAHRAPGGGERDGQRSAGSTRSDAGRYSRSNQRTDGTFSEARSTAGRDHLNIQSGRSAVALARRQKAAERHSFIASDSYARASENHDFVFLDGDDPDAAARFLRQWAANVMRQQATMKI